MVFAFRTSHLSAPDWAVGDALRNWRVRGPGRRALNPISPKAREAGPRKPGPGSGPPRYARRALPGAGAALTFRSRCFARQLRISWCRSSWACYRRRRRARLSTALSAGGREALTFGALRLTPCAFTSPFTGSAPLSPVCACALLKPPFVPMATGRSPTLPPRLFAFASSLGPGWGWVRGRPQRPLKLSRETPSPRLLRQQEQLTFAEYSPRAGPAPGGPGGERRVMAGVSQHPARGSPWGTLPTSVRLRFPVFEMRTLIITISQGCCVDKRVPKKLFSLCSFLAISPSRPLPSNFIPHDPRP